MALLRTILTASSERTSSLLIGQTHRQMPTALGRPPAQQGGTGHTSTVAVTIRLVPDGSISQTLIPMEAATLNQAVTHACTGH